MWINTIESVEVCTVVVLNLIGYSIDRIFQVLYDIMAERFGWHLTLFECLTLSQVVLSTMITKVISTDHDPTIVAEGSSVSI